MWANISRFILRNRIILMIVLTAITGFMAYNAFKVRIVYEFARLLPETDSASINYEDFKKRFGLDGNVLVLSVQDENIYKLDRFNDWYQLSEDIKKIQGIQEVVSITRLYNLTKNDSLGKFEFKRLLAQKPSSQQEVDGLKAIILRLPFYDGFVFNKETHATVMAVTFDKKDLDSKNRLFITDSIKSKAEAFAQKNNIQVHYSGLPYIRTSLQRIIASEMIMFMLLALGVTILILFLFFRSGLAVALSLLVIVIGVIWSFGTLALLGYKITVLTGLIAPLIIVIGVPNCILLLNKYHMEFSKYANQSLALTRTIEKVGVSLFFANITTAIGFAVFCSTRTQILFEFGLVSSINVVATYVVSLILIPGLLSFLSPPSVKHTKHLQRKRIAGLLEKINHLVINHRPKVYIAVIGIVIISVFGMTRIKSLGFVVDDLPKNHPIYSDLNYFEKNFHGVLPFEIVIDTKKENGVFADNGRALYKIGSLQKMFVQYPQFSKPVSVAEGVKFGYQAFKDGNPKFYRLPGALDFGKIATYATDAKQKQNMLKSFIDSTKRYTRVSVQMADIGSIKMKKLVNELKPRIDTVFNYDAENKQWVAPEERYDVTITGFCVMFLKGNDFLIKNLLESVLLAIVLIALVMFTLFMTGRMVFIAVIPSLVPLLFTAGLMGFFNIHLKPSTILIFSIAFGIASDGTLYFLTKYRQELKQANSTISKAVSSTIRETGISMIYTAIILSCGFGIFAASKFGGTAALGILISFTLLVAYCSNLILLPCFLLSLEKRLTNKEFMKAPMIDIEEYEDDVEDKKSNE
jgi:predicted RND superfamily exporter protein